MHGLPPRRRRNSRPRADERLGDDLESSFATEGANPLLHAAEFLYLVHTRFEWGDLVWQADGPRLLPPDSNGTSGAALEEAARSAHEEWDRARAHVDVVLRETGERGDERPVLIAELEMKVRRERATADDAGSRRLAREHDEAAERNQAEIRRLRAEAVADRAAVTRAQADTASAESRANRARGEWLEWLAYAAFAEAGLSARQARRDAETAGRRSREMSEKAGRLRAEAKGMT